MAKPYNISIDAMRGALWRRLAVTFCSIAFAFNILCGVALSLASAQTSLASRALQNRWNIICSASGPIVTAADGSRIPDDQTGALGAAEPRCLFCLPLMHGDVALAAAAGVPTGTQAKQRRQLLPPAVLVAARFASSQAWPRAPPPASIG